MIFKKFLFLVFSLSIFIVSGNALVFVESAMCRPAYLPDLENTPVLEPSLPPAKNAIYAEAFGNLLWCSINYDRLLTPHVSLRIGGFFFPAGWAGGTVMVNRLYGKANNFLELGGGIFIAGGPGLEEKTYFGISTRFGYRFQPRRGGIFFAIAVTPLLNISNNGKKLVFSAGMGLGWCFR
jgi:hypothetical protein